MEKSLTYKVKIWLKYRGVISFVIKRENNKKEKRQGQALR